MRPKKLQMLIRLNDAITAVPDVTLPQKCHTAAQCNQQFYNQKGMHYLCVLMPADLEHIMAASYTARVVNPIHQQEHTDAANLQAVSKTSYDNTPMDATAGGKCSTWVVSSRRTNLRLSIQRECVGGMRSFGAASSPPLPSSLEPAAAAFLAGAAVRRSRSSTGRPASCTCTNKFQFQVHDCMAAVFPPSVECKIPFTFA